jgi:hypothetical protein
MLTKFLKFDNTLLKITYVEEIDSLQISEEEKNNLINSTSNVEIYDRKDYTKNLVDLEQAKTKLQKGIDSINDRINNLQNINTQYNLATLIDSSLYNTLYNRSSHMKI